ncbi:MAG: hypothetical protein NVS2B7_09510 [Herpetosiphon sp.]
MLLMKRGIGLFLVTALMAVFLGLNLAEAHAKLVRSTPSDGAVLSTLPASVTLVFSEELKTGAAEILVVSSQGTRIDVGDARVDLNDLDHTTVVASIKAGSGAAGYTIHWKVVAADDGGVSEGSVAFKVLAPSTAASPQVVTPQQPVVAPGAPRPVPQVPSVAAPATVEAPRLPATGTQARGEWMAVLAIGSLILGLLTRFIVRRA